MNKFEPTPEQWGDILEDTPKPTKEQIASRQNPDDIADMSGKNLLGQRDRDLVNRVEGDKKAAESLLERIKKGLI